MSHKTLFSAVIIFALSGCATTTEVYDLASNLKYETELGGNELTKLAESKSKGYLKDEDSLKNLRISSKYKCYASKMGVTDNLSPKFGYGYWCYNFSYNAKNSYGAYVKGDTFLVFSNGELFTINQIDETVRKSDDIWVYAQPEN